MADGAEILCNNQCSQPRRLVWFVGFYQKVPIFCLGNGNWDYRMGAEKGIKHQNDGFSSGIHLKPARTFKFLNFLD